MGNTRSAQRHGSTSGGNSPRSDPDTPRSPMHQRSGYDDSKESRRFPLALVAPPEGNDVVITSVLHAAAWDEHFGKTLDADAAPGASLAEGLGLGTGMALLCDLYAVLARAGATTHYSFRCTVPRSAHREYAVVVSALGKDGRPAPTRGGCCQVPLLHLWFIPLHVAATDKRWTSSGSSRWQSPLYQCTSCRLYSVDGGAKGVSHAEAVVASAHARVKRLRRGECMNLHAAVQTLCGRCSAVQSQSRDAQPDWAHAPQVFLHSDTASASGSAATPGHYDCSVSEMDASSHSITIDEVGRTPGPEVPVVLIVEGDDVRRAYFEKIVSSCGMLPVSYQTSEAALDHVTTIDDAFESCPLDGVIANVALPGRVSLKQLVKQTNARHPNAPIIAVGGAAEFSDVAVSAGATVFVKHGLITRRTLLAHSRNTESFRNACLKDQATRDVVRALINLVAPK